MNGRVRMDKRTRIILIAIGILYLIVTSMVDFSTFFKRGEETTVLGVKSDQISRYYVYMYDISTGKVTTIASNEEGLFKPSIYDNRVVYTSYENGNGDIYMYDIATGETKQITSDPYDQDVARIYGDAIVWDDSRSEHAKGSRATDRQDVYMYNLSGGVESSVIRTRLPDRFPDIYENSILVEIYLEGAYGNIYVYDLLANNLEGITSEPFGHDQPRIYKDKIVWYTLDTFDIYVHDLSTAETRKLTEESGREMYPNIHENMVIYQRLSANKSDIFAYDLYTQEEIQVTDTLEFSETTPDIYDNKVVFVRMYSPEKMDVFVYDLATRTETRIESPSDFKHGPEIYGNRVVWAAFDVSGK